MNIGRLISPIVLHNRPNQSTKRTNDVQETQQTHTPIAIPNQLPHCERSYFKQSQFLKNQGESKDVDASLSKKKPKLKKIDSELSEIDKLKNQYAKRLKTQNYSQEKILNKSNERHLLKPSAAPKIGVFISQFSVATFNQRQNKNIKQQTFSFQVEATSPKSESNSDLQNKNSQIQAGDKKDMRLLSISDNKKCNCQTQFNLFMQNMKQKMTHIANRVKMIQQTNSKLKNKNKKPIINSKSNQIISVQKQNPRREHRILTQNSEQSKQTLIEHYRVLTPVSNNQKTYESKKGNTLNEGSKAKVEALLQRLHLRIQKQ